MSTAMYEELLRFLLTKSEDPEVKARQKLIGKVLLDIVPEVKAELMAEARLKEGLDKGRLVEARSVLRRVLLRRKLTLSSDEQARIDACTDLAMLERWHDQAVDASSVEDALR